MLYRVLLKIKLFVRRDLINTKFIIMEENRQIEITFELTFLSKKPVEIKIKAENRAACRILAICYANLDFPTWLGMKEIT
jgi:hypothetical protein